MNATYDIPRRLQFQNWRQSKLKLFSLEMNLDELHGNLRSFMLKERDGVSAMTTTDAEDNVSISPLNNYEGIFDGLFSLSCHPIVQIRGGALHIVNHALSQYGFFIWERVPQLLSALELEDSSTGNSLMYGIPSTSRLSLQIQAIVNDPHSMKLILVENIYVFD